MERPSKQIIIVKKSIATGFLPLIQQPQRIQFDLKLLGTLNGHKNNLKEI